MKITIDRKFPKLESGNDCNGREITSPTGERLGAIYREIDWRMRGWRADGGYIATVTGYRLELYGEHAPDETTYPTLSEATAAARKHFATA